MSRHYDLKQEKQRLKQERLKDGFASQSPVSALRVPDLGIVSFYVEDPQNVYLQIWREEQKLPVGETCFRTLVFGPAAELAAIELPSERNVRMRSHADRLQGVDAYKFLLRLLTGLESKREGDSHIVSQFKDGWIKFQKGDPAKAVPMETLVQYLTTDSRLIVTHFAKDIHTQNIQNAAKLLIGHKGSQRAIIMGNGTADKVSPVTISMARVLSTPGKTSVSEIGVVHPDPEVRARILEEFELLRRAHKLDPGLMLRDITVNDLPTAFENYDRVYSDLPMEMDSTFDGKVIQAWSGRERQDNRFAHLRGSVARQGLSSPAFTDAEKTMTNYFSPEQVMAKNAEIGVNNRNLRTRAEALVEFIGAKRLSGQNVLFEELVRNGLIDAQVKRPTLTPDK